MDSIADKSLQNGGSCSTGMLPRVYPGQLKDVEFVGHHGVELIRHLVENLVALENIVADTPSFNAGPWERIPQPQNKAQMLARAYNAKDQLQKYVP